MSSNPGFFSRVKEATQSLAAGRRPWSEFLDLTSLNLPSSVSDATTRITQNLTHFRVNYTLIVVLILFLSILFYHPLAILPFVIVFLGWLFLYCLRDDSDPFVVFNCNVDDSVVFSVLVAVSIFTVFFTHTWANVAAAVVIDLALVVLHAVLRSTDDLVMEDFVSPYGDLTDSPRGSYAGI
ncbi:PRA1 family protein D [Tripterygium wilfordii]|uniref:PRA1 family protein D n=1 Tax=Tripterygium wilfordii TaxID=458696 RepID=UPI0018F814A7|nr:PRA1 family protein D [Tripterygium wilfordii]